MNRAILQESNKAENGGPGQPGERVIGPAIPMPPSGGASEPLPQESEAPPPEVSEPPAGSSEPPPEELRLQPGVEE